MNCAADILAGQYHDKPEVPGNIQLTPASVAAVAADRADRAGISIINRVTYD